MSTTVNIFPSLYQPKVRIISILTFDTMLNYEAVSTATPAVTSGVQLTHCKCRGPADDHELRQIEEAGDNAATEQKHERLCGDGSYETSRCQSGSAVSSVRARDLQKSGNTSNAKDTGTNNHTATADWFNNSCAASTSRSTLFFPIQI